MSNERQSQYHLSDEQRQAFRTMLESAPLETPLTRIDRALQEEGYEITMEVAEDTYAWLEAAGQDVAEGDTAKTTFYVDTPLEELQEDVPQSDFSALPTDDQYEAHDLVYPDVTLRCKFDEQHKAAFPVETQYENITVMVPGRAAYVEQTLSASE